MDMKFLSFTAGTVMLIAASGCTTKIDVPAPDDPRAQEWTPSLKQEYPKWQPPVNMPQGTPEYTAVIAEAEAPAKSANADVTMDMIDIIVPEDVVADAKNDAADKKEEVKYPVFYSDVPMVLRVDVKNNDDDYVLDGNKSDIALVKEKLAVLGKAHGEKGRLIIHAEKTSSMKNVNSVVILAAENGIRNITLIDESVISDEIKQNQANQAAQVNLMPPIPPKTVTVIDTDVPAQEYVVLENDTLSSIALKFYKRAILWNFIFEANKDKLKSPHHVRPGMKLKIPALKTVNTADVKNEEVKPVEAAPAEEVKPVEAAPAEEVKPVEAAPAEEVKPVEATPAEEVKPVEAAPAPVEAKTEIE